MCYLLNNVSLKRIVVVVKMGLNFDDYTVICSVSRTMSSHSNPYLFLTHGFGGT